MQYIKGKFTDYKFYYTTRAHKGIIVDPSDAPLTDVQEVESRDYKKLCGTLRRLEYAAKKERQEELSRVCPHCWQVMPTRSGCPNCL